MEGDTLASYGDRKARRTLTWACQCILAQQGQDESHGHVPRREPWVRAAVTRYPATQDDKIGNDLSVSLVLILPT